MTTSELIQALIDASGGMDQEVIIRADHHGYDRVYSVTDNHRFTEVGGDIEVGIGRLTTRLRQQGYTEEDVNSGARCIVIS